MYTMTSIDNNQGKIKYIRTAYWKYNNKKYPQVPRGIFAVIMKLSDCC